MTALVPIGQQIAEVRRELTERRDRYAREVRFNLLDPSIAHMRNRDLMAVLATLAAVERHAEGLRLLITYLIRHDGAAVPPPDGERAAILAHPAVRAVMESWPDGRVAITEPAPIDASETPTASDRDTDPDAPGYAEGVGIRRAQQS